MITFRLFGFPIRIQWMFWLLCVFLGIDALEIGGRYGFFMFLILTGTILVSIIWHELGHAFTRQRYGASYSEITLWGLGGYCAGPGHFSKAQHVKISAAGPVFNFLLGGLIALLLFSPAIENPYVAGFVGFGLWVNFGWGLFNLFPILPLDGGRILANLLPDRHMPIVPWIGLVLAGMMSLLGFLSGRFFLAILFGLIAFENWKMVQNRRYRGF